MRRLWVGVVLLVLAVAALAYVRGLRADVQGAHLRADSLEAVLDTSRAVVGVLDDSLAAWQRRAVQVGVERDELAEALGVEVEARTSAEVRLRALRASSSARVVEQPEGVREASFSVRQEPYTVLAEVLLPAPPSEGVISLTVGLDPILLTTRVGCREREGAANEAVVLVSGPEWAELEISDPLTEPEVCNPPAPMILPEVKLGGGLWTGCLAGGAAGALTTRGLVGTVAGTGLGCLVGKLLPW